MTGGVDPQVHPGQTARPHSEAVGDRPEGLARRGVRIGQDDRRSLVTVFPYRLLEGDLSQESDGRADGPRQVGRDLLATPAAEDVHPRTVGQFEPRHVLDDTGDALPGLQCDRSGSFGDFGRGLLGTVNRALGAALALALMLAVIILLADIALPALMNMGLGAAPLEFINSSLVVMPLLRSLLFWL